MEHVSGINPPVLAPVPDWQELIDKYYHAGSRLRDILLCHSRCVAGLAHELADRVGMRESRDVIEAAAMLHDIGIKFTNAPSIYCVGRELYLRHGIIGGALLRKEGVAEGYARVAERHTGSGLTANEIADRGLPLPVVDLVPVTPLEKLICYADKFYSKSGDMKLKSFECVRGSMEKFGSGPLERFDALAAMFGKP